MREFIKSFLSFGLASVVERVIAFVLLPIYTHYFNTAEFGAIDLVQVIIGVVSIFAHLQLETSLQRYYYEYEGREKHIMISTIVAAISFLSLVITVPLIIFSQGVSELIFKNANYSSIIKLAALQLVFINYSMLALVILRYEKKNIRFAAMILLKVFLTVLFIVVFVVWLKKGLYGVFYAQLIGLVVSSIALFFSVREFNNYTLSYTMLKRSIVYAFPQFPARIGSIMLTYANRFFMVGYLTISAIGIYSLSLRLASVLQLVYTAFVMAWAPFMFSQMKNPEHKKVFSQVLLLLAGPVYLIVCIFSLFSKEIVTVISSNQFHTAYHYLGGLALYNSLMIFKEVVDIGPKFTEKTKYLSFTFFLSVIVNIGSLYFFIRLYGLYGVVYSMLITNVVLLIVSWIVSNKLYYIPFSVYKFVFQSGPAFVLAIGSMYILPGLFVRIIIAVITIFFYSFNFLKCFKVFKASRAADLQEVVA
jgi:O-antigen/teichoic acid export membrane protein